MRKILIAAAFCAFATSTAFADEADERFNKRWDAISSAMQTCRQHQDVLAFVSGGPGGGGMKSVDWKFVFEPVYATVCNAIQRQYEAMKAEVARVGQREADEQQRAEIAKLWRELDAAKKIDSR